MFRFAIWAVSALLLAAPAVAQSFEEAGVERWGADYRRVSMKNGTAADCARACAKDARCKSWTFARPGVEGPSGACHLKGAVPSAAKNPCCDSGVSGGSSMRAFAETPRVRAPNALAAVHLTPSGMTGSIGKAMEPTGLTGSIGPAAPSLSPLQPAVMDPATSAPLSIQPETWNNEQP